jgi:hypothetical protein
MLEKVEHDHRVEAFRRQRQVADVAHDILVVNPGAPTLLYRRAVAIHTNEMFGTREILHGRLWTATDVQHSSAVPQSTLDVAQSNCRA